MNNNGNNSTQNVNQVPSVNNGGQSVNIGANSNFTQQSPSQTLNTGVNQNHSQQVQNVQTQQSMQQPVNIGTSVPQQMKQPQNITHNIKNNNEKPKKKKAWIFLVLGLLIVGLIVLLGINKEDDDDIIVNEKVNRTTMIYMVGSNLESDKGQGTNDINDIDFSKVDFENNNIIIITGGAKKWHNNIIKADETAIYKATKNGLEKLETYKLKNMGLSKTLSDFLNYTYKAFPAEKYDLIFWDHGSAMQGLESDELSNDNISLEELSIALKDSPFNSENKIETIIFQTCLMGSIETADIVDEYANYMVASEEVMYLSKLLDKWTFFSQLKVEDNGLEIGKKFVDTYYNSMINFNQLLSLNGQNRLDLTYSVIDLSKIEELKKNLYSFFGSIDINGNYNYISTIRAGLKAYGTDGADTFEMVDLYELVNNMKFLSPTEGDKVLTSLKDVVVYNKTLNSYSNGLSIYFPYNGSNYAKSYQLNEISKVSKGTDNKYLSFVTKFNNVLEAGNVTSGFDVLNNIGTSINGTFNLELTEEQSKNYAHAKVMVFKDMGDGYYMPLYASTDVSLNNNILTANYSGKALSVVDKKDNSESNILLIEENRTEEYTKYSTPVYFQKFNEETSQIEMDMATLYIVVDKNNPNGIISSIVKKSELDEEKVLPSMELIDMEDYQDIYYTNFKYKILDENNNYTTEWESSGVSHQFYTSTDSNNYEYKITDLNDGAKYYAVFGVYDVYNKLSYSNLIPLS